MRFTPRIMQNDVKIRIQNLVQNPPLCPDNDLQEMIRGTLSSTIAAGADLYCDSFISIKKEDDL